VYFRKDVLGVSLLAVSLLVPSAMSQIPTLSPPWYRLYNEILYSVGRDPGVTVDPLDTSTNPYVITLHVKSPQQASALASIMIPTHTYGNVVVNVLVRDSQGNMASPASVNSTSDVTNAYVNALATNPLLVAIFPPVATPFGQSLPVIFGREVVQFFDDDLSEAYSNFNGVAATVFADVLQTSFGNTFQVVFGTQPRGPILLPPGTNISAPTPATAARRQ
jgi:hypothetical protein